jgi:hypothetical protein
MNEESGKKTVIEHRQRSAMGWVGWGVGRLFALVGTIANLLALYEFGEKSQWWNWSFSYQPTPTFWMLAVGVGGPWAMILGSMAGAKVSESITRDKTATRYTLHAIFRVGSFFALLHCSQMSFGLTIFPRYLSANGFVFVAGIYLLTGFLLGVVFPLVSRSS